MTDKSKTEQLTEDELDQVTGGSLLLPAVQSARESYSNGSKKPSEKKSGKGRVTALDALLIIN